MWTTEYFVRYVKLPRTIHGTVLPNDDGTYDIYINSLLSPDQQEQALAHALDVSEAWLMGYDVSKSRSIAYSDAIQSTPISDPTMELLAKSVAQLNSEGRSKLVEYADDLVSSRKYSPQETHTAAG